MLVIPTQESLGELLAQDSSAVTRKQGRASSPGAVRVAAKARLCVLDTHPPHPHRPPSDLPWHKRLIHWYVRILVLDINLPYLCMW